MHMHRHQWDRHRKTRDSILIRRSFKLMRLTLTTRCMQTLLTPVYNPMFGFRALEMLQLQQSSKLKQCPPQKTPKMHAC